MAVFKTTGKPGDTAGGAPQKESVSFTAGQTIFQEGDLGTDMFIIMDGQVRIEKRIKGDAHVLSMLDKGDFFGEM